MRIKNDAATQRLAKLAWEIQDACNPYPVAKLLCECIRVFGGHDEGLQHPVTLSVLNKLNHLAHLEQTRTDCFSALGDLIKGQEVEWEVREW